MGNSGRRNLIAEIGSRVLLSAIIAAAVVGAGCALLRLLEPLLVAVAFGIVFFTVLGATLPK
jgi:hypothetical protein